MPIIIQFWINSVLIYRECISYSCFVRSSTQAIIMLLKVCKVNLFVYFSTHNSSQAVITDIGSNCLHIKENLLNKRFVCLSLTSVRGRLSQPENIKFSQTLFYDRYERLNRKASLTASEYLIFSRKNNIADENFVRRKHLLTPTRSLW